LGQWLQIIIFYVLAARYPLTSIALLPTTPINCFSTPNEPAFNYSLSSLTKWTGKFYAGTVTIEALFLLVDPGNAITSFEFYGL